MIAPHLWESGYGDSAAGTKKWTPLKIFAFCPINTTLDGKKGTMHGRNMKLQHTSYGEIVEGFYANGLIDAVGGGCALYPFDSFAVEDLLQMEAWMVKNFHKEIDRAKKYNKVKA